MMLDNSAAAGRAGAVRAAGTAAGAEVTIWAKRVRCGLADAADAATASAACSGKLGSGATAAALAAPVRLRAADTLRVTTGESFFAARGDRSAPACTRGRAAALRGLLVADESADVLEGVPPVSESGVSAAAIPVPDIRAEPTPTITAPVPRRARRSAITNHLRIDNGQTLSRQ
jgi:hypothetical protein